MLLDGVFVEGKILSKTLNPSLFPDQAFPGNLNVSELENILGVYNTGKTKKSQKVEYEPDPALRDNENIPLKECIVTYFLKEVRPFVADAWINRETTDEIDGGIGKVAYEINFNRYFYKYEAPRSLEAIETDIEKVENELLVLLKQL